MFRNVRKRLSLVKCAVTALIATAVLSWGCKNEQQGPDLTEGPVLVSAPPLVVPENGFIPDEATAVKVAEAILIPIYGEKQIAEELPFKAVLERGIWTVSGTLPPRHLGGTAVLMLSRRDGRVLYIAHEE